MRQPAALVLVLAALVSQRPTNDEVVESWYPILHAGNTWVYADEARDAAEGFGIDNPTIGRWTTMETVSAVETTPDGTRVTIRSQIADVRRLNGWRDQPSRLVPASVELVLRGHCLYGHDAWSFCFPMHAPGEWGRGPSTPPDEEGVWTIRTLNADSFGVPGARTFHVYGHQGSGDTTDYWFQEGVGIVQFVEEHHGTYDEHRRTLLSATIDGVTRTFTLKPARTPPLDPAECRAGWRHWIRTDGTLIPNLATCVAYARTRHP